MRRTAVVRLVGYGFVTLVAASAVEGCSGGSNRNTAQPDPSAGGAFGGSSSTGGGGGAAPSGGGANGGGGASGSGGNSSSSCVALLPAGGNVAGVTVVPSAIVPRATSAGCDGAFVVAGVGNGAAVFTRKDGTQIQLAEAPLFVADFDTEGFARWAQAVIVGEPTSSDIVVRRLADGSVVAAGSFGTSATFDRGGPAEKTLKVIGWQPYAFVARYGADGSFKWVKQLTDNYYSSAGPIVAGPDGSAYVAVVVNDVRADVVGKGELDLTVPAGGSAIVRVEADGRLSHGAVLAASVDPYLWMRADGDLAVAAVARDAPSITDGTHTVNAPSSGVYLARLSPDLAVRDAVPLVDRDGIGLVVAAGLPDGSLVTFDEFSVDVTRGTGGPNQVTLVAPTEASSVLARYGSDGQLRWAWTFAGKPGRTSPVSVEAHADDSIWVSAQYLTGTGTGTPSVTVGPESGSAITHSDPNLYGVLARVGADGKPAWALPITAGASTVTGGLAGWPGGVIVSGRLVGPSTFGNTALAPTAPNNLLIARVGP